MPAPRRARTRLACGLAATAVAAALALAHRLILRPELWVRRVRTEDVVAELLEQVPTPPPEAEPAPVRTHPGG